MIQSNEVAKEYVEMAKTIFQSIDHYREAGREDVFNIQSIAEYLQRQAQQAISVGALQWVRCHIKVGEYYTELDEPLTDCFTVAFRQECQLQISKVDGRYIVSNAVNGWGNNCKEEFKDAEVKILYEYSEENPIPVKEEENKDQYGIFGQSKIL